MSEKVSIKVLWKRFKIGLLKMRNINYPHILQQTHGQWIDKSCCKSIEKYKQVNIESSNFVIARNTTCITHSSCQLNFYPPRVINIKKTTGSPQFGAWDLILCI